eukprot:TRINITY_DN3098_c1_g1_i1.p1 TRINITY_DN3098_c1_g1~~TRINITY_DN3098_c1_g1_i1.p1  ORF type:complete len:402 (+),score=128.38 TRINITY_DN3098_c1_g1_i1:24-1229(+)
MSLSDLAKIVPFVFGSNVEARSIALQTISQYVDDNDAVELILRCNFLSLLSQYIAHKPSIIENGEYHVLGMNPAFDCLINLSETEPIRIQIIKNNIVENVLDWIIRNSLSELNIKALMFLSNITLSSEATEILINYSAKDKKLGFMILKLFVISRNLEKKVKMNPFNYMFSILMNCAQNAEGCDYLLNSSILKYSIPYLTNSNPRIRGCVLGLFKNLAFNDKSHEKLVDLDIHEHVLFFLADHRLNLKLENVEIPDFLKRRINDPDTKFEEDIHIRRMSLEVLLLLLRNKKTRIFLKNSILYKFLNEFNEIEEDQENKGVIADVVHYLVLPENDDELNQEILAAQNEKGIEINQMWNPSENSLSEAISNVKSIDDKRNTKEDSDEDSGDESDDGILDLDQL